MKRRFVKTLITTIVVSSLIVTPVLAEPTDNTQSLEEKKSTVESQAASVNSDLVSLIVQLDALRQDMSSQEDRIGQAKSDLHKAEENEKEQYEAMKLRIKYMYEQGETSFMEAIVSAENYSDLVNKSEYVQKVHTYDRKMLEEYVDTKQEVEDLKVDLESQQAEMEAMAGDLETQQSGLEGTLAQMKSQIADFDSQLAAAQETAAAQLGELTEQTQNIAVIIADGSGDSKGTTGNADHSNAPAEGTNKPSNGAASKPGASGGSSNSGGSSGGTSGGSSGGGTSNASLGQRIASKACTYVGNRYEYGGNSLTNGVDCSGFVQQIHKLFGISTPRTSDSQLYGGRAVSYSNMLPGDVIVYSGHVAIYIGNNQIVHASNSKPYPAGGIKISSPPNYRTILGVRRYW